MGDCGAYPRERAMLNGFLCSIAIALSLLIAAPGGDEIIVETSNATIESRQGQRLRVVLSPKKKARASRWESALERGPKCARLDDGPRVSEERRPAGEAAASRRSRPTEGTYASEGEARGVSRRRFE